MMWTRRRRGKRDPANARRQSMCLCHSRMTRSDGGVSSHARESYTINGGEDETLAVLEPPHPSSACEFYDPDPALA